MFPRVTSQLIANSVCVVVTLAHYINYGTPKAVPGSAQLQHLQFTQEHVIDTIKQSATTCTSLMENAVYTTAIEVTHPC